MATTLWAAYAAAIASLAAPAGLNLGSTQRFAISNQNDFSIPAVPYVNQYYQNHNVYRFASVIPAKDPVLTLKDSKSQFAPSGHTYDAAYTKYIDSVLLQVPHDVRIQAQINETVTKMADLTNKIAETRAQAQVNFARDCPNGIDPFTDKPTRRVRRDQLPPACQLLQDVRHPRAGALRARQCGYRWPAACAPRRMERGHGQGQEHHQLLPQ